MFVVVCCINLSIAAANVTTIAAIEKTIRTYPEAARKATVAPTQSSIAIPNIVEIASSIMLLLCERLCCREEMS